MNWEVRKDKGPITLFAFGPRSLSIHFQCHVLDFKMNTTFGKNYEISTLTG